jgi:high affinity Mn2+ porin
MLKYLVTLILLSQLAIAQDKPWSVHFQLTVINQTHSGFKSPYSGINSLADTVEPSATSVTSTVFIGRRLWKNAALYVNPELSGGKGLSYAVGVAGALNGETYRVGDPVPVVSIARAYIRQVIPLGTNYEAIDDDINQLGETLPTRRLSITAGKFSMADFYDDNTYSHDPRTEFLNWSLMSNGAWDYPANTKGYTMGLMIELTHPNWAIRLSTVAVPKIANHSDMEYRFGKAHSETAEFEYNINIHKRPGTLRLLISHTASRAPSYKGPHDSTLLKAISGNALNPSFGGHKTGIGLNAEQALSDNLGIFARAGWNDGKDATWAFTEIDQTAHAGLSLKGSSWKRPNDVVSIAAGINGISKDHRAFLKAGNNGFIIGDGTLTYGHENLLEAYYNAKLFEHIWFTADYQFINHPGYNKDRGPVHVFALRGHIGF